MRRTGHSGWGRASDHSVHRKRRAEDDLLDWGYGGEIAGAGGEELEAAGEPGVLAPKRTGACNSLALYLRDVRRQPRMSARNTGRCRCALHDGETAAFLGNGPRVPGEVDEANRQVIIEAHLALVVRMARRYERFGLALEDLIQEGNLGLLAAAERFDPERGVPFPTYATAWIRQAICRAISIQTRTIRIPLEALGLRRQAARVWAELEQEAHNDSLRSGHYRAPTVEDCARKLGVSTEHLRTTVRRLPEVASLDAPLGPEGEPLLSYLAEASGKSPEDCAAAEESRYRIEGWLRALPDRTRLILQRHYDLDGNGAVGFAEIGRELRLSRERVRQLHNNALRRLQSDSWVDTSANGRRQVARRNQTPRS